MKQTLTDIPAKMPELPHNPLFEEARRRFPGGLPANEIKYESLSGSARDIYPHCPIEGNNGHWQGEACNSKWAPDGEYVPGKCNPENKNWNTILAKYGIDGVTFKDGDLDLQDVSKGTVRIDEITTDRSDNFDKADIALAKERGCSPEEVANWRHENKYTWHESKDGHTMQKVPSIIHGNIPHSGGVAEAKKREAA